jgi:uracil-DNA glycosylase family 4
VQRDEVFLTNVLKCRPGANREPEATEVAGKAQTVLVPHRYWIS